MVPRTFPIQLFSRKIRKLMTFFGFFMIFPGGLLIFVDYPNFDFLETTIHIVSVIGLLYFGLLFGKDACIRIDDTQIFMKGLLPGTGFILNWENISSIRFGVASIDLYDSNQNKYELSFQLLKYEPIQELKSVLSFYAKEKSIKLN